MAPDRHDREDLLLDFHLDRLSDEDRAFLEAELLRDKELRSQSDRLGDVLRPLDSWNVANPPANLADRVLRAVARQDSPVATMSSVERGSTDYRPRIPVTLTQLLAAAASIAILVSVAVPGLSNIRAKSQRAQCASNLGSLFRGVSLYQQGFGGSLPFAGGQANAAWLPTAEESRPFASNSRHVYLIAKFSYAKPEDFVCPACGTARAMRADELADYNDFADCRNFSYASLNQSGSHPNLRPNPRMPYMSDPNPLFVNAQFNPAVDPMRANSSAHGRMAGQSVMLLDGNVRWMTTPLNGPENDNIWTAGQIRLYKGTETPSDPNDAFLIPGYPRHDRQSHKPAWQ